MHGQVTDKMHHFVCVGDVDKNETLDSTLQQANTYRIY